MPTITQFEIFVRVIDEGSFTKAAQTLHMSQPAVSHAISALESELGVTLLVRERGKDLIVTDIGKRVLFQIRNILNSLEKIDQEVSLEKGLITGTIRIATFPSVTAHFLPKIISTFQQKRRNVSLTFKEGSQEEIKEWLISREIDIGFVVLPCRELETIPLVKDRYIVMLPDGHPLLQNKQVRLIDLENEPFIISNGGYEAPIINLMRKQKISIIEKYNTANLNTSLGMIKEGLGVLILPELSLKNLSFPKANIRPLETNHYRHIALGLPSLKGASRAVQLFIEITKELFD
ncbi:LysR family transcriptional regulator [Neobacillus vireti]|uniref:LysR family transcriptional regulator n=1 Tax=Neobacillus vireti LMG 21834 TaxID=1131730 RepID=A0AB94IP64_9BACI|nr:LysR family transcriptional regulator [Neobacillus vireti]ETI68763.1 LysR family transcriptional regulator [Neobacillus vireti LMG 21834]KLT18745.1 LysR family transcriptional regulator [Neobacillus vireti]